MQTQKVDFNKETGMELEAKAFGVDAPDTLEMKKAFEDFLGNFEAFKQGNDERLKGLEKRSADVLLDEKVERINKALEGQQRHLDTLLLDAARPALAGERKSADPRAQARGRAFDRYVRAGDAAGLLEVKAMSEGSNADGGYTVPLEIERTIDRVLAKASPIRGLATVRQIGGGTYRKPIVTAGAAAGWTGESDAISSPTTTPTLAALDFPAMELYAMPAATQTLLDDSQVDIEQWLAEEVQTVFAEQEGAAFVKGTGPRASCNTPPPPMRAGAGASWDMSPLAPTAPSWAMTTPPPTRCSTWPMRPNRPIAPMGAG
jgi:HK97 family phage major capsid protein